MKTVTNHLRDKIYKDLSIVTTFSNKIFSINDLYGEWSEEFEDYMRSCLMMGAIRYGKINSNNFYDYVNSIIIRAKLYYETGNTSYLVDIANFCMLEYVKGLHPKKHHKNIDDGIHVGKIT